MVHHVRAQAHQAAQQRVPPEGAPLHAHGGGEDAQLRDHQNIGEVAADNQGARGVVIAELIIIQQRLADGGAQRGGQNQQRQDQFEGNAVEQAHDHAVAASAAARPAADQHQRYDGQQGAQNGEKQKRGQLLTAVAIPLIHLREGIVGGVAGQKSVAENIVVGAGGGGGGGRVGQCGQLHGCVGGEIGIDIKFILIVALCDHVAGIQLALVRRVVGAVIIREGDGHGALLHGGILGRDGKRFEAFVLA